MTQSRFYTAETLVAIENSQLELLDILKIHHQTSVRVDPEYSATGSDRVAYRATTLAIQNAEEAILNATKNQPEKVTT